MSKQITLAHGNGGLLMRELVEECFARKLANTHLNTDLDAAQLNLAGTQWAMTTDGFTVQPLFFPGGNIGSLAIHGTVNDLAVSGARARYLSLNAFIEEGLSFSELDNIISAMASAANEAKISIVTGDTKVVPRGHGGGIYFATTGIGEKLPEFQLHPNRLQAGDKVIISGPIGNHGIAVMMAREDFGLHSEIQSDSANVWPLVAALRQLKNPNAVKLLRDPTRGGLNMVVHDWSHFSKLGIELCEHSLPIQPAVNTVCNILGYDPLSLACEGRIVAAVESSIAEDVIARWRNQPLGQEAAVIGELTNAHQQVVINTTIGGQRLLSPLEDEPLPRIC